jgi:hypothetical protein
MKLHLLSTLLADRAYRSWKPGKKDDHKDRFHDMKVEMGKGDGNGRINNGLGCKLAKATGGERLALISNDILIGYDCRF